MTMNVKDASLPYDLIEERIWLTPFKIDLQSFNEKDSITHSALNIYTDGSKMQDKKQNFRILLAGYITKRLPFSRGML